MKKTGKCILYLAMAALAVWIAASFLDVNSHNLTDRKYSSWNMVVLAMEMVGRRQDTQPWEAERKATLK